MSGEGKRSDGLLGESGNERRRSCSAPPALPATAEAPVSLCMIILITRVIIVISSRVTSDRCVD
jgi:hypothetical protein